MTGSAGALGTAIDWIDRLLIGSIMTSIAVLAIALLGAMMLTGRVSITRGVSVVVGCFIVFAAAQISSALTGAFGPSLAPKIQPLAETPSPSMSMPASNSYNPYTGASLPASDATGHDLLSH